MQSFLGFTITLLNKNIIARDIKVKQRNKLFSSITVNMKLVLKSPPTKEETQPSRKDFQDRWPGLLSKHTTGKNQSPFPPQTNNYTLIEIIRGGLKTKFRTVMGFFFNLLRDAANAPDTILIRAAIKPGGRNDGVASHRVAGRLHISIVNRRNVLSWPMFKLYLRARN